jgi:hypothetical protein
MEQQRIADERARAEAYARAEQKRMAEQRQIAEANARAEQEKAAAQARVDRENTARQAAIEQERAAAQSQLQAQNAAAAAAANQQRAQAEAAAQRQAAANAKRKNGKQAKPAKTKPYPDDEPWVIGDPYIHPENYTTLFDKHAQAMAAAGAAADSSLYDQHFDGTELNALGRTKIALMLQAAPKNEPLTIYVPPTGANERVQARLAAVNKFWRDSQWAALTVQAKQGTNPETSASAAAGLAGLRKLEKEEGQAQGGGPADRAGGSGGSGGSSGGGGGGGMNQGTN